MRPLLFVNWRSVHAIFCGVMWVIAVVLAVVVLAHTSLPAGSHTAVPASSTLHHASRMVR